MGIERFKVRVIGVSEKDLAEIHAKVKGLLEKINRVKNPGLCGSEEMDARFDAMRKDGELELEK